MIEIYEIELARLLESDEFCEHELARITKKLQELYDGPKETD